jgi:hypothetical protein
MRKTSILGWVFVVSIAAMGCSSSDVGGTGGTSGSTGGSGGTISSTGGSTSGGAGGHAGGSGGLGGAGGASDCNPECPAESVCVGSGIQGGAVFFADAGVCPQGRHAQGNICVQDLSYSCMPLPSACNGTVTCSCAGSLCPASHTCSVQQPGELTCIEAVP